MAGFRIGLAIAFVIVAAHLVVMCALLLAATRDTMSEDILDVTNVSSNDCASLVDVPGN